MMYCRCIKLSSVPHSHLFLQGMFFCNILHLLQKEGYFCVGMRIGIKNTVSPTQFK